jgi:hypothetical protein
VLDREGLETVGSKSKRLLLVSSRDGWRSFLWSYAFLYKREGLHNRFLREGIGRLLQELKLLKYVRCLQRVVRVK